MRRALAFLTPFGHAAVPTPRTLEWFPAAGALIGAIVGCVWWAAGRAWAPLVAAAVTVAADAALTGYLHLDGLADAADGLLAPMDRERRLEVLRDPSIGAFGAATLLTVVLLRFSVFAVTPARVLVVAGLWCGSRTAMAVVARVLPYARPDGGLATAFVVDPGGEAARGVVGSRRWSRWSVCSAVAGLALAVFLAALGSPSRGVAAIGAEAAGSASVAWLALRRIGGFTGDVLGAAGVIGETAGLLVLVVR